jgi:hypothetical protein
MEIGWTDRVKNEEVLHRVKEERNILHTINRRKANWIGHILRRICVLKHVTEGKIRTLWRARFGRDYGPVVRQLRNKRMNRIIRPVSAELLTVSLNKHINKQANRSTVTLPTKLWAPPPPQGTTLNTCQTRTVHMEICTRTHLLKSNNYKYNYERCTVTC